MKRVYILICLIFHLLLSASAQQADVRTIYLGNVKIDQNDTLLAGAYHIRDFDRLQGLIELYLQYDNQRLSEQDREELQLLETEIGRSGGSVQTQIDAEAQKQINQIKKSLAKAENSPASSYAQSARVKGLTPEEMKEAYIMHLKRMLESFNNAVDNYSDADPRIMQQYQRLKQKEKTDANAKKQMREIKQQIASLMVDGKLHNYDAIHDFRHGRAAVAKREKTKHDSQLVWGFVDERMNLVIPRRYAFVFDFNNYKNYRSQGVFEEFYDRDTRPWTTVGSAESGGAMIGMIDKDGNEVIPIKFICHEAHHMWIEFFNTPWGEYAPVTIMTTPGNYLEGIIDRNGNYTLEPTYEHLKWYKDLQCFGTTGDNRIYFDHKGNRLNK